MFLDHQMVCYDTKWCVEKIEVEKKNNNLMDQSTRLELDYSHLPPIEYLIMSVQHLALYPNTDYVRR